ncbi:unnamed protein product, partial [Didymodactylos carnosus]
LKIKERQDIYQCTVIQLRDIVKSIIDQLNEDDSEKLSHNKLTTNDHSQSNIKPLIEQINAENKLNFQPVCAFCSQTTNTLTLINEKSTKYNSNDKANDALKNSSLNKFVLLQTATTIAQNGQSNQQIRTRIILDVGSQRSFITEKLFKQLKLPVIRRETISLFKFGAAQAQTIERPIANVDLKLIDSQFQRITVNVVPTIVNSIHRVPINTQEFQYLIQSVSLADPLPTKVENCNADILLGNEYYDQFTMPERIKINEQLYLLGEKFGRILSGCISTINKFSNRPVSLFVSSLTTDLGQLSSGFLKQDDNLSPQDKIDCPDDEVALKQFNETIQFQDQRYFVQLPWRNEKIDLPNNKQLAIGRLNSLVRRFHDKPELLKQYDLIIQDQIDKGIIEEVQESHVDGPIVHYIPHQAVITPTKTTTKPDVTAWVLRFINKSRKRSKENSILSVEERSKAKLYCEKVIQSNYLNEVIESIQKNSSNKLKKQLGLWLDQDGVIRCGGRLKNVESNDCCDFPKLLLKHSSFTKLVIQEYHHKVLHSGVSSTLSQLRHKYWIPQGRSVVSNYVKKCILCIKLNVSPYKLPAIPALPVDRVTPSAPFSFTGIDYLGPLILNDSLNQITTEDEKEQEELDSISEGLLELSYKYDEAVIRADIVLENLRRSLQRFLQVDLPNTNNIPSGAITANGKSNVRLPKLEIEKFDGETLKWKAFWGVFVSAIHENSTLNVIEKFTYLRSQLNGDAFKLIASYPVAAENYHPVVQVLKETYDNNVKIADNHFYSLFKLTMADNNKISLRAMLINFDTHLRALEALEIETEHRCIFNLFLSKLPNEIRLKIKERQDIYQCSRLFIVKNSRSQNLN